MSYAAQHAPIQGRSRHLHFLDRSTTRILLTILMYAGIVLFLYPYAASRMSSGAFFLISGAVLTLICGGLRCYLTEGGCSERANHRPAP